MALATGGRNVFVTVETILLTSDNVLATDIRDFAHCFREHSAESAIFDVWKRWGDEGFACTNV